MGSTILLADDSLTIQKVVELTFSDTEHEVVAVSTGEDLLERLPDTRPDLVICDILMPGTDGYEVCQRIKSDPGSLHIPVILLTGTFEPFDRDRALAAGCSEIITKPFEARRLVETVERLLAGDAGGPPATSDDDEPAAGAPAAFPGQVAPPPPAPAAGDPGFETRLAPPEPTPGEGAGAAEDEGLEFTASGFAEMEAAGEAQQSEAPTAPDEGLEFEVGDTIQDDEEPAPAAATPATMGAEAAPETTTEEPFGETDDTADIQPGPQASETDDPFAEPDLEPEPEPGGPTEPIPSPHAGAHEPPESPEDEWDDGAFDNEAAGDDLGEPPHMADEDAAASPNEFDDAPTVPEVTTEAGWDDEPAEAPPPPFATPPAPPATAVDDGDDGTDADDGFEADDGTDSDGGTDTAPIVQTAPLAATTAGAGSPTGLSDEDVERIARRVLELASEQIEHIAWEVVPDMAEIVVRERIRQLEADADDDSSSGR